MNEVFERMGASKSPVTKMELLDALAWMDALLEAGWTRGVFHQQSRHNRRSYPDQHCLVGAARVAVLEVAGEAINRGRMVPLLTAVQELLVEGLEGDWLVSGVWKELFEPCAHMVLMNFNDRQEVSGPVRELVQRAAAKIGSK